MQVQFQFVIYLHIVVNPSLFQVPVEPTYLSLTWNSYIQMEREALQLNSAAT